MNVGSLLEWKRPQKYLWVIHAEEDAILKAPQAALLRGCTAYVTGLPCLPCFRRLAHVGISRLVCGPLQGKQRMTPKERVIWEEIRGKLGIDVAYRGL